MIDDEDDGPISPEASVLELIALGLDPFPVIPIAVRREGYVFLRFYDPKLDQDVGEIRMTELTAESLGADLLFGGPVNTP